MANFSNLSSRPIRKYCSKKFNSHYKFTNKDKKLLMKASQGDINQVKKLINNDVRLDAADNKGRTALHLATENGNDEVLKELLKGFPHVTIKDENGNTPLDLAKGSTAELLNKHIYFRGHCLNFKNTGDRVCRVILSYIAIDCTNLNDSSVGSIGSLISQFNHSENHSVHFINVSVESRTDFNFLGLSNLSEMKKSRIEYLKKTLGETCNQKRSCFPINVDISTDGKANLVSAVRTEGVTLESTQRFLTNIKFKMEYKKPVISEGRILRCDNLTMETPECSIELEVVRFNAEGFIIAYKGENVESPISQSRLFLNKLGFSL